PMSKVVLGSLLLMFASLLWPFAQVQGGSASAVRNENQEGFTVVGISVRATNEREARPGGEIPKMWARVMSEGMLDSIPNRADKNIVVVNSGYASDEHGEYDY